MRRCGIVILAAGGSTRMGVAKQSLKFEGESLLRRAVGTAMASVCRPVIVVLGAQSEALAKSLENLPVLVVLNEKWSAGIGSSIRAGVAALSDADAVMIFLADQPLVTSASLNDLVSAHFESGKQITAATYGQTIGTPAVFADTLFDELLSLQDEQGGKAIINRHPQQVQHFALPTAETDVDTPEDFDRLRGRKA